MSACVRIEVLGGRSEAILLDLLNVGALARVIASLVDSTRSGAGSRRFGSLDSLGGLLLSRLGNRLSSSRSHVGRLERVTQMVKLESGSSWSR